MVVVVVATVVPGTHFVLVPRGELGSVPRSQKIEREGERERDNTKKKKDIQGMDDARHTVGMRG